MILGNNDKEQYVHANQDQADVVGENDAAPVRWAFRFAHATLHQPFKESAFQYALIYAPTVAKKLPKITV